jgi:serine/threonine-protein kinase RsbW
MSIELSVHFGGGPFAAAAARRALGGLSWKLDPTVMEDVQLLVSELVTNAVRHAHADATHDIELLVRTMDRSLRVEVADGGPGFRYRPRDRHSDEPGGWGLYLVEQLARSWGVDANGEGARVWFELPLPSREPALVA